MITRIVRMSFKKEEVKTFLEIFDGSKEKIRAFTGCEYLSLHQDHHHPNVYYTISRWENQAKLEEYRKSALFQATWTKTKLLFNDKPLAYSLDQLIEIT